MTITKSILFLSAVLMLLPSCTSKESLQGKWAVDLESTVRDAKNDGMPSEAESQVRETFDGGRLEITDDAITMRVRGINDAVARNYKTVDTSNNCYRLRISQSPVTQTFCVNGDQLTVHDPSTKLAVVYKRE